MLVIIRSHWWIRPQKLRKIHVYFLFLALGSALGAPLAFAFPLAFLPPGSDPPTSVGVFSDFTDLQGGLERFERKKQYTQKPCMYAD